MFCKNCGKPNDEDAKYCTFCGRNLRKEEKEEAITPEAEIEDTKETATVSMKTEQESETLPKEVISAATENIEFEKLKEKAIDIGNDIKEKISNIDVDEVKDKAKNFAVNEVENYKNFKNLSLKQKLIRIAAPAIILIIIILIFVPKGPSDEDYILCAHSAVSDLLKSPSTATYSNEEVVEKDDYGRVLVTLSVDSQNSFGAYVRTNFAVVIESYDTSTEKFVYYPNGIQKWTDDYLKEVCIEGAKIAANWNEPLKESD